MEFSQQPFEEGTAVIPISQSKKQMRKEVRACVQGCTAGKCYCLAFNPGSLNPELMPSAQLCHSLASERDLTILSLSFLT